MDVPAPPRQPSWLARRVGPERDDARLAHLDGVRAIAVLLVVVLHCWVFVGSPRTAIGPVDLTWLPAMSGVGVHIFFMLSAFLLAQPWFRAELTGGPRPTARRFWRRRLTRIVPAYYVSIAVCLAILIPLGRIPREAVTGWLGVRNLGGQALFAQGLYPVASNLDNMNGVYWTLTVEMSLYLLLPVLVWLFAGRRWRWALVGALVVNLAWTWSAFHGLGPLVRLMAGSLSDVGPVLGLPTDEGHARQLLNDSLLGYLFNFALGIALARLAVVVEQGQAQSSTIFKASGDRDGMSRWLGSAPGRAAFWLGAVGLLASMYGSVSVARRMPTSVWSGYIQDVGMAVSLALMLFGIVFGGAAARTLSWLPLRFVGWISYGLYLFHFLVIRLLHEYTDLGRLPARWEYVPLLVGTLLGTGVVATLSWAVVERPLLVARGPRSRHGHTRASRRPLAFVLAAVGAVVAVVAVTAPMAATAGTADGLFRGPVTGTTLDPSSGPATLAEVIDDGQVYPREAELLSGCAAVPGSAVRLFAPSWNASATAFECVDDAAAAVVVEQLSSWESSVGFGALRHVHVESGAAFYHKGDSSGTTWPAYFHVRMSRGRWVVGISVQADTAATGRYAVKTLLAAVRTAD